MGPGENQVSSQYQLVADARPSGIETATTAPVSSDFEGWHNGDAPDFSVVDNSRSALASWQDYPEPMTYSGPVAGTSSDADGPMVVMPDGLSHYADDIVTSMAPAPILEHLYPHDTYLADPYSQNLHPLNGFSNVGSIYDDPFAHIPPAPLDLPGELPLIGVQPSSNLSDALTPFSGFETVNHPCPLQTVWGAPATAPPLDLTGQGIQLDPLPCAPTCECLSCAYNAQVL